MHPYYNRAVKRNDAETSVQSAEGRESAAQWTRSPLSRKYWTACGCQFLSKPGVTQLWKGGVITPEDTSAGKSIFLRLLSVSGGPKMKRMRPILTSYH
jgi:hypothetical protein